MDTWSLTVAILAGDQLPPLPALPGRLIVAPVVAGDAVADQWERDHPGYLTPPEPPPPSPKPRRPRRTKGVSLTTQSDLDAATLAFMETSSALARAALAQARQDDPEAVEEVGRVVRSGGFLRVHATLTGNGPAACAVEVIGADGRCIGTVTSCSLEAAP